MKLRKKAEQAKWKKALHTKWKKEKKQTKAMKKKHCKKCLFYLNADGSANVVYFDFIKLMDFYFSFQLSRLLNSFFFSCFASNHWNFYTAFWNRLNGILRLSMLQSSQAIKNYIRNVILNMIECFVAVFVVVYLNWCLNGEKVVSVWIWYFAYNILFSEFCCPHTVIHISFRIYRKTITTLIHGDCVT